jgi:hypothetical protein
MKNSASMTTAAAETVAPSTAILIPNETMEAIAVPVIFTTFCPNMRFSFQTFPKACG